MSLTPSEFEAIAESVATKLAAAPLMIDKHELAKRTTVSGFPAAVIVSRLVATGESVCGPEGQK